MSNIVCCTPPKADENWHEKRIRVATDDLVIANYKLNPGVEIGTLLIPEKDLPIHGEDILKVADSIIQAKQRNNRPVALPWESKRGSNPERAKYSVVRPEVPFSYISI